MAEHQYDPRAIVEAVRLIVGDGVTEVRAVDATYADRKYLSTLSGYFDDAGKLAAEVCRITSATGIYFVPNPVDLALLARAANRIRKVPKGGSTQDTNITRRKWLFVDCDPERPSGISEREAAHEAAIARARTIYRELSDDGWPEPIVADSGNGAHLLHSIDLPTEDGGLVERCLLALSQRFDDDAVKVDTTTFNAAQLCKLYGTPACKGDSTAERPHRTARILHAPAELVQVSRGLLEVLAGEAAIPQGNASSRQRSPSTNGRPYDVQAFIDRHGLDADGPEPWDGHQGRGSRWILRTDPMDGGHDDGSCFIIQHASGAISAGSHHKSAKWGWEDLREKYEPRASGSSVSFVSGGPGPSGENWPEVLPLPDDLPPVRSYESDMLPASLRAFVGDIAERLQCPADFPAAALVTVLGSVIGRRCGIRPRRKDDWLVVPNLWGGVVGRPSLMKTPAIKIPLKLLYRLEAEGRKEFEEKLREHAKFKMLAGARNTAAKQRARDAVEANKSESEALAELAVLDDVMPPEPTRRRYVTNDATVEKTGVILSENPMGIMNFRDELVGWLYGLEKDNQQGARAFYLEAWDGTGRFTYDRIGRGTIEIESATVSVFGGIQPSRLAPYVRSAVEGGIDDDGMIQRFQLLVWPDAPRQWRNVDRWPDTEARTQVFEIVERLHETTAESVGAEVDKFDHDQIPFLRFDNTAQQAFEDWRDKFEPRLRSGDEHPAIEAHLGKFRSLLPSLALIFHLAEHDRGPVTFPALALAFRWAEYLETHARRIYSAATAADVQAGKAIWRHICKGDLRDGFNARDIYRKGWTGLTDSETVKSALDLLVEYGHIVEQEAERPLSGRAPHPVFNINPIALKAAGTPTDKTDKTHSVSFVREDTGHSEHEPDGDEAELAEPKTLPPIVGPLGEVDL